MGIAAAHILEPILDQPHRTAEPPRQMRHQHGLLDAALDAVAAADIDILMHAHAIGGNPQRARDLVGILRHLDRRPDVEHLAPRIPRCRDAKRLDRHGGIAAPGDAERQMARAFGEMFFDLAPDKGPVQQHVGAVAPDAPADCPASTLLPHSSRTAAAHRRRAPVRWHLPPARGFRQPPRRPIRRRSGSAPPPADGAGPSAYRARSSADRSRRRAHRRSARNARPASPALRKRRSKRCAPPDAATAAPPHAACLRARRRRRSGHGLPRSGGPRGPGDWWRRSGRPRDRRSSRSPRPVRRPRRPRARLRPAHRVRHAA